MLCEIIINIQCNLSYTDPMRPYSVTSVIQTLWDHTVEPQLYRPYGTIQWNLSYTDPMGPYSGTSVIQTLWDWH